MAYTTIKKPSDYFNTKIHNGTGVAKTLAYDFEVDMFWTKMRNQGYPHMIFDAVRGNLTRLETASTGGQSVAGNTVSFGNSSGISLGSDSGNYGTNKQYLDDGTTTAQYVGWGWKANGTGSSNTDGTITSTVSANTTSGFSIAKYTGTGSNASFGHGLGTTPAVYIIKKLTGASTWLMYHQSLGIGYHLGLNNTSAKAANDATFANNTAPDTSKIYLGTWGDLNSGTDFICYSFAEKQGYSKFGSYVGNNSATDGTFFYTGFKPAMIIIKKTDNGQWTIFDNKRNPSNAVRAMLVPNGTDAELSQNENNMDFLSNGVKMYNGDGVFNADGSEYIYMAFAEEPLVGDNPATAR